MKKMVKCKACGFLMEEGKYGSCPACGVADKMFEPYEDKVPENRRKLLSLDIHPIVVHFPVGFSFLTFGLAIVATILSQTRASLELFSTILATLQVVSVLFPVFTLGGMLSGLLDGYYRYKSVTTPLLVKKIVLGSAFLVLTIALPFIVLSPAWSTSLGLQVLYLAVDLLAFACAIILGLWGAKLMHGVMVGPFVKKKKPAPAAPAAAG